MGGKATYKSDFLNALNERGFIAQGTNLEGLDAKAAAGVVTAYTRSAQETTLPHSLWTRARRSLMISNPLKVRFGGASCSLGPLADPSSSTDASHP